MAQLRRRLPANQNFNAVIWGEQRREWPSASQTRLSRARICVAGSPIQMYNSWPQIQDVSLRHVLVIN